MWKNGSLMVLALHDGYKLSFFTDDNTVIQAGLVEAKMDQLKQMVHIRYASLASVSMHYIEQILV